jgi:hypothetical protein
MIILWQVIKGMIIICYLTVTIIPFVIILFCGCVGGADFDKLFQYWLWWNNEIKA